MRLRSAREIVETFLVSRPVCVCGRGGRGGGNNTSDPDGKNPSYPRWKRRPSRVRKRLKPGAKHPTSETVFVVRNVRSVSAFGGNNNDPSTGVLTCAFACSKLVSIMPRSLSSRTAGRGPVENNNNYYCSGTNTIA